MDTIFISYSHSEFRPVVEKLISALHQSLLLQRCEIRPFHIAEFEAFRKAPIENSVHCVSRSRYLISLVGKDLGETVLEGKSHIEHEIDAALEHEIDVLTFLVGDHHADKNTQRESVSEFLNALPNHVTLHSILTNDPTAIVDSIIRKLETSLWASLGCDDNLRIPEGSLLVIDGQSPSSDHTEHPHHDQCLRIFDKPTPSLAPSPIASSFEQRKLWAFQSLELNHLSEATQNLLKATEEFGSDFFSCFWLSRIYALQSDTSSLWKSAIPLAERAISSLREEETLLRSVCNTHIAIAYSHIGDFERATHHYDLALSQYEMFETLEYKTDMVLNQFALNNNQLCKQHAVDALATLLATNLKHYVALSVPLSKKNPTSFEEAESVILQDLNTVRIGLVDNYTTLQLWAESALNLTLNDLPLSQAQKDILPAVDVASQHMWKNYSALRTCGTTLAQFYESHAKHNDDLEKHHINLKSDHQIAMDLVDALSSTIDERKNTNVKESELQTRVNKEKRTVICWDICLATSLAAIAWCFYMQPTFIWAAAALSFLFLLLRVYFDSRRSVATVRLKNSKTRRRYIHESVTDLVEQAMENMALPHMRSIVERLKSAPNYLNHEDLSATKSALNDFVDNQSKAVAGSLSAWETKSTTLNTRIREWINNIDQFEHVANSPMSANLIGKISQRFGVSYDSALKLSLDDALAAINTATDRHCFQLKRSRTHAWFDDPDMAKRMLDFHGKRDKSTVSVHDITPA
ncbi:hypothetical protein SAMN02745132_02573 [Enterovibrio nigricans DSM 22720]|uniref:Uncharacterized protein n=1 Tax=Enterovibrio nigricans DSM 22720 TaxID=1121868 RepID=A0A1T4UUR6_9GAMM|nr:hypothetical protein SAMN02745132_02573 [Enterovibrio nigricans DSM 22720]